ncbi:MAG: hypothetical protein DME50_01685 [Verrucomicrobia bacterium]|nr:MAG: hypothetical protein DME50_01685 [Verrucomicrobiota bacterium]
MGRKIASSGTRPCPGAAPTRQNRNPDGLNMKKKTAWDEIKAFAIELVKKKTKAQQIDSAPSGKQFALEIGIYVGLLLCYFFLVLSFLSNWLKNLFDQNKLIYALVAWALVAGQGVVLEIVAVALLKVIKSKTD